MTSRTLGNRFWVDAVLGGLAATLAIVTSIWRGWIEALFGVDPDHGDGGLERAIVVGLAVAALALAVAARVEWRRAAPASQ